MTVARTTTLPKVINPALKSLEILVGDWDMELSNGAFLPRPSDIVKGSMSFEWMEDGAYLVMRIGDKASNAPWAIWLISRDESVPDYQVLYYDNRSVSRVYGMSFSDGVWKLWRNSPGFSQRYEGKISANGNVVTAHWDKSTDGSHWEHDFDVKYTRVK